MNTKKKATYPLKYMRNSPMKSPSPDYMQTKNTNTTSPFKQVSQYLYNKPSIKKTPQKSASQKNSIIKLNSFKTKISDYKGYEQNSEKKNNNNEIIMEKRQSKTEMLISNIYVLLKTTVPEYFYNKKQTNTESCLDQIYGVTKQILTKLNNRRETELKTQIKEFETFAVEDKKCKTQYDSPIIAYKSELQKTNENYQKSILEQQLRNLDAENKKIHKQLIFVKIQTQKLKNIIKLSGISLEQTTLGTRNYSPVFSQISRSQNKKTSIYSCEQEVNNNNIETSPIPKRQLSPVQLSISKSNTSFTTTNFLRQKIKYLQSQIQNKSAKITLLEYQHKSDIQRLQKKLDSSNYLLQNQMQNYSQIINQQKQQIKKLQQLLKTKNNQQNMMKSLKTPIKRMSQQQVNQSQFVLSLSKKIIKQESQQSDKNIQLGKITSSKSIEDYDFKQCYSEQQSEKDDPNQKVTMLRNEGNKIREYYENLLNKKHQDYENILQKLMTQIGRLKSVIQFVISIEDQGDEQCGKCKNLLRQKVVLELEKTETQKQMKLLQYQIKEKNQYIFDRIKEEEELSRYKSKLLIKLNQYQIDAVSLSVPCQSQDQS